MQHSGILLGQWSCDLRSWPDVCCAEEGEQGAGSPQQRPVKGVFTGGSETEGECLHGEQQSSATKNLVRRSSETNYDPGGRVMTAEGKNAFAEQIHVKCLEEMESQE